MTQFARRAAASIGLGLLAALLPAMPARADPARPVSVVVPITDAQAEVARKAQWYLAPMRLARAQQLGNGGEGVTVAVLDTGVDGTHQDLRGALVAGWTTAGRKPADNIDTGPHGTGIAALIAGRGHGSGRGVLGVAPRARIMPVQPVFDHMLVADGIRWAVEHGAKVINMSFALKLQGESLRSAIADAAAADVVLVGAVGNDGGAVELPAGLPGVLGVGSVDRSNRIAPFSNRGAGVDLVTYGTDIPLAEPGDRYVLSDGTSDSSALVAGAVALLRARYPDMSAAEVVDRLTRTAIDRGPKGRDDHYGAGQLDLIAALTAPRTPPSATVPPSSVTEAPASATEAPAGAPLGRAGSFPPWLVVLVGVLLLIAAPAGLMIVRSRRSVDRAQLRAG